MVNAVINLRSVRIGFTDEQNEQIRNDLIQAARHCGTTIGMRKTSVEQLTEAVGISRGHFTNSLNPRNCCFRCTGEHPYRVLRGGAEVLASERNSASCRPRGSGDFGCLPLALKTKAFVFIENDADFLLHRLPEEVKPPTTTMTRHTSVPCWSWAACSLKGGMALAAATVRGLILTVSHQEQIGALYPQVLETLVRGACRELFA